VVCVCVCMCVCGVCACVCMCVRVCVCMCVWNLVVLSYCIGVLIPFFIFYKIFQVPCSCFAVLFVF